MARIDLEQLFSGATQALTGAMAGQMAGEQIRRQREMEQLTQMMQAEQSRLQREDALRQRTLGVVDKLAPESQEPALAYALGQSAFSPTVIQAAQRVNPAMARTLGQPVTAPPAVQPLGFDRKAAERTLAGIAESVKAFREANLTPEERTQIEGLIGRVPGQIRTAEELRAAEQIRNQLQQRQLEMGPRLRTARVSAYEGARKGLQTASPATAHALLKQMVALEAEGAREGTQNLITPTLAGFEEEIAEMSRRESAGDVAGARRKAAEIQEQLRSSVDPKQEGQRLTQLISYVAKLPAHQANDPKFMRQLYQNFGLGHMLEGMPENQVPYLGGARSEERLHQLIQKMSTPQFALLDWPSQRPLLEELAGLSKLLGKAITIPQKVVANLTPYQRAWLRRWDAKFRYTQAQDEKKDREEAEKAIGKLTDIQREALRKVDAELKAALKKQDDWVKTHDLFPGEIDLNGPQNTEEQKYVEILNEVTRLEAQRENQYRAVGIQTPVLEQEQTPEIKKPAPKVEPPPKKGLLQRAAEVVTGAGKQAPKAAAKGVTVTPQEKSQIERFIDAGQFDRLMKHPSMLYPENRMKAKRVYREKTGREWTGAR